MLWLLGLWWSRPVSAAAASNSDYCEELLGMKQGLRDAGGLGLLQRNG